MWTNNRLGSKFQLPFWNTVVSSILYKLHRTTCQNRIWVDSFNRGLSELKSGQEWITNLCWVLITMLKYIVAEWLCHNDGWRWNEASMSVSLKYDIQFLLVTYTFLRIFYFAVTRGLLYIFSRFKFTRQAYQIYSKYTILNYLIIS